MTILFYLVLGLLALALALVLLLLFLRVFTGVREARHQHEHEATRTIVLSVIMGEDDEVLAAQARLAAMRGGEWDRAEDQIFSLLPKVTGDLREQLVDLVRDRGAAEHARALLARRSAVARCRGAHRLGALRSIDDVPALTTALADKHFLVRRVALRALGSIGDPRAVPAILAATRDARLSRDVVSALQRIGIAAAPELRGRIDSALSSTAGAGRVAEIAVIGLGLIGDHDAVTVLSRALDSSNERVRAEAATALGRIGAPGAIDTLVERLGTDGELTRRAAAEALGAIGDVRAAPGLGAALGGSSRLTARALASALLRLGEPGRRVLREHESPYAREALATDALRTAGR